MLDRITAQMEMATRHAGKIDREHVTETNIEHLGTIKKEWMHACSRLAGWLVGHLMAASR